MHFSARVGKEETFGRRRGRRKEKIWHKMEMIQTLAPAERKVCSNFFLLVVSQKQRQRQPYRPRTCLCLSGSHSNRYGNRKWVITFTSIPIRTRWLKKDASRIAGPYTCDQSIAVSMTRPRPLGSKSGKMFAQRVSGCILAHCLLSLSLSLRVSYIEC